MRKKVSPNVGNDVSNEDAQILSVSIINKLLPVTTATVYTTQN